MNETARREHVLEIALATFARYGYRKTSMEDVAQAADISRPGLYFLFASKQNLFQAAVVHALEGDLAAAEQSLADGSRPLSARLIEAFDFWTGRYIGPMTHEVTTLMETNPELLGPIVTEYPQRFRHLLTTAIDTDRADDIAGTLISTSIGIKHDATSRKEFVTSMTIAIDLLRPMLTD